MSGSASTLPIVFMFSGQGSQYYGMGKELHESNEVFRTELQRYDSVVAEYLGESVLARIFDPQKPRNHPLSETRITHPGIVMIELALARALNAEGIEPDYILGSSLGEYAAAVVAGSLAERDCFRLLVRQADKLRTTTPGGMLAVLAGFEVLEQVPELRGCDIAARNYPGNFVVSGTEEELARSEAGLRAADVLHLRLPVEYGFHSHLMDDVLDKCRVDFDEVTLTPPGTPWVSCVDGKLVEKPTRMHFEDVARRPIEFERAIQVLREGGDFRYLDVGPSGSLHNFVRSLLSKTSRSESLPLLSQFGKDTELFAEVRKRAARPRKASSMKVYGFPGQGSQRRGMGKGLFERFPEQTATADRILGYSIEQLCLDDPRRELGRTEFTQPALYVVEALSYLDRREWDPIAPDYLVGHSLGEYVALFAAGVFDFETGLRLVRRRGELLTTTRDGSMAAVIGADRTTVTQVLAENLLDGLDLANDNAVDQFVLSGPTDQIDAACGIFESVGARTVRLNVSAPLHSRYMREPAEEYANFLDGFELHAPRIPVLANVDAMPYTDDTVKQRLVAQITSPVRWSETVRGLMGRGDFEFVELGPGQVLTKLVTSIKRTADPIARPEDPVRTESPMVSGEPVRSRNPATSGAPITPAARNTSERVLGSSGFRERYGLNRAYVVGSMYGGVSGPEVLRSSVKAGLLAFLGIGGLTVDQAEQRMRGLVDELGRGSFGVNLLYPHGALERESTLVDLLLRNGIDLVEASGYPLITEQLVRFRLKGGRIVAKVSRTDVATEFLAPPPERLVARLLASGAVSDEEAATAAGRPMADDLCVEANGGWLADTADLLTLLPAILRLRDATQGEHHVHVGCAGGIGSPEAAAAAFLLGADFVLTGSVNQCSVEAATSDAVKDLLHEVGDFDVTTAPWGELFEYGVRAHYLRRGLFFPARANRLYELWRQHASLSELDEEVRNRVLGGYLGGEWLSTSTEVELTSVFRSYFERGLRAAVNGDRGCRMDYLVHCGAAMGAFNTAVAGTELEPWRARTIEAIADVIMDDASSHVADRLRRLEQ